MYTVIDGIKRIVRDFKPEHDPRYQELVAPASYQSSPTSYEVFPDYVLRKWNVVDSWTAVRRHRDQLLAASDKTQQADSSRRFNVAAWAEYRQQLADIPETYPTPADVVWPEKPE